MDTLADVIEAEMYALADAGTASFPSAFAKEIRATIEDACIPRPPKAEWFEKWHCWWVWVIDASDGPPGLIFTDGNVYTEWEDVYDDDSRSYQGVNGTQDGCGYSWRIDKIAKCLPVKAENWQDYPSAVGWQVVGEE